jgi:SAM-dependent methyltransferase
MLHLAEAKRSRFSEAVQRHVRFVNGDMADFESAEPFVLVIISFRSFHHLLTPEDQRRCRTCIHCHLRADGRLIINLFDPRLDFCWPEHLTAPRSRVEAITTGAINAGIEKPLSKRYASGNGLRRDDASHGHNVCSIKRTVGATGEQAPGFIASGPY